MVNVTTTDILKRILTDAIGDIQALNACKIGLYTQLVALTRATLLADLVEATFDGYTRSSVVNWGTVLVTPEGTAKVLGDIKEFVCTGTTNIEVVYGGMGIIGGTVPKLSFAFQFDNPIPIQAVDNYVAVYPEFEMNVP